ncbi:prolipoprotein diacylglyceryl transferase [Christensenellaceae bacterium OttesenSCG-928-K19]|nr:prolipoprotein diacylglyceryl transferase [Christensenellaceae bacterium OttesenSCG-928-K19]
MQQIDKIAIHNLFGIEGLDIAWYGIIIAAGIVIGVAVAVWQAKKRGYTSELIFDLMIVALPLAIVGARLYYVAFEWDYYSQHPEKIIEVWNGGIAIYGAVIGAVVAALIVCKWRKFPLGRMLDIAVPGLILGQAIGRWGNFVNQEAFGAAVTDPAMQYFPFAVYVENVFVGGETLNGWFYATFFYESMWNLGVFVLLLWYAKRAKHDGNVFAMYLIGYGIGRLWIEGVRIHTLTMWPGGMPVSQFLSIVLIAIGVIYILVMRKRGKPNMVYEGRYLHGWLEEHEEEEKELKKAAREQRKKDKDAQKIKNASAKVKEKAAEGKTEEAGE